MSSLIKMAANRKMAANLAELYNMCSLHAYRVYHESQMHISNVSLLAILRVITISFIFSKKQNSRQF